MKPIELDPRVLAQKIKLLEQNTVMENLPVMFDLVKELVPTFHHNKQPIQS